MTKKLFIFDVVLLVAFFFVNYFLIIQKVGFLGLFYNIFVFVFKGELIFPVWLVLVGGFFISRNKRDVFLVILNMIFMYLLLWFIFFVVVYLGINKYGT